MRNDRDAGAVVLIVDDCDTVRRRLRAALQEIGSTAEVIDADDGLRAYKLALNRRPDVIVCDLVMPRFDGLKFLSLCASHPALASVPIIMLTAADELEVKVGLLDRGAADYVTKPCHDRELIARVRVHLRLKRLQDELRHANAQLEVLSNTDPLTGLRTRRHFERVLSSELAMAARYATPVSVVMVDVDHFKQVNDTFGHAMGDAVLRNLAKVFTDGLRANDTAARHGGEEFVIVLPHTSLTEAAKVAERLRGSFAHTEHQLHREVLRKTASFGVACYTGTGEPPAPSDLVARADGALYRAKGMGRNCVCTWPRIAR